MDLADAWKLSQTYLNFQIESSTYDLNATILLIAIFTGLQRIQKHFSTFIK